ncbi:MAG: DNA primase [Chloroflexi bacterium]|nr:DNA primase [Chloroflexota bacterium]
MSQIDEIKNLINIEDLVGETVKLRRTGKNYIGFCPFHANTRTPSFVVFPESGTWRCFGQCAEGGDVFSYLMKRDNLDFQQALAVLAQRAGVKLESFTREDSSRKQTEESLHQLIEDSIAFYHNLLMQSPAGKTALAYLHGRGLQDETIRQFQLGYAPDSWNAVIDHLLSLNYSRTQLIDTGMASEQRDDKGDPVADGRIYDRFRNRVMIPIRNAAGKAIGFGARILDPNDVPKFLNSPQTVLFDKGATLFGFNFAKSAIRERSQAVIVEGYFDVITLHQAGFPNTVSSMGTAIGANQVKLLTRQSKNIVLALDADEAGANATLKGIEVLRDAIRQEGRLDADIRVTTIPEGKDPDEIALRDPAEWQSILDNAKPIVIFMMETAARGQDLQDAKVKSQIAATVLPLIEEVSETIEREVYRQQLADFLSIDARLLRFDDPNKRTVKRRSSRFTAPETSVVVPKEKAVMDSMTAVSRREVFILNYMFHFYPTPGSIAKIDRTLRQRRLAPISRKDFESSEMRQIADCYFDSLDQDENPDIFTYADQNLPESIRPLYETAILPKPVVEMTQDDIEKEMLRSIVLLRRSKNRDRIREAQALQNDDPAEQKNHAELTEIFGQLLLEKKKLDHLLEALEFGNKKNNDD